MDKERWMCRFKASRALLAEIQNELAALVSLIRLIVFSSIDHHCTLSNVLLSFVPEQSNFTIVFNAKRHGAKEFRINVEIYTHNESVAILQSRK